MDPRQLFFDDRNQGSCIYCCGSPDSRDHVPSRVLLDKPYPENLPVVPSCSKCNKSYSLDEEYLSCFLECVIHGTTTPDSRFRKKVRKTLESRKSIRERIEKAKCKDDKNNLLWEPEIDRVNNVVLKLAFGHLFFELGILTKDTPRVMGVFPIP